MSDPWFNPTQFGAWYGTIAGCSLGLLGAIAGTLAGVLIPKGKGYALIPRLMKAAIAICALQLTFGVFAIVCKQPWGIWYPPLLVGFIGVTVFGLQLPMIRRRLGTAHNAMQMPK